MPLGENRVTVDTDLKDRAGLRRPVIHYRHDDYVKSGLALARQMHDEIARLAGLTQMQHALGPFGAGHIIGTARMGKDAKTSVVDASLRSHEHPNLYIVGASAFPTGATANPTLTIAALALRAVPDIARAVAGA